MNLLAHVFHPRHCADCGLDREVATAAPVDQLPYALFFVVAMLVLIALSINYAVDNLDKK